MDGVIMVMKRLTVTCKFAAKCMAHAMIGSERRLTVSSMLHKFTIQVV